MPFYEYQCTACTHTTEELQKVNDPPLVQCPACGKNALEKVISATGFQLMGSGWYETDFKDKKPQPSPKNEETTSTPTEKAAEKTTPEKTIEKTPPKEATKKAAES